VLVRLLVAAKRGKDTHDPLACRVASGSLVCLAEAYGENGDTKRICFFEPRFKYYARTKAVDG
jgi:hypothetical protein